MNLTEAKKILENNGYIVEGIKDWLFKKKSKVAEEKPEEKAESVSIDEVDNVYQSYIKAIDKIQNYIKTNYDVKYFNVLDDLRQSTMSRCYIEIRKDKNNELYLFSNYPLISNTLPENLEFYTKIVKYNGLYYDVSPEDRGSGIKPVYYKNVLLGWNGVIDNNLKEKIKAAIEKEDSINDFDSDNYEP